MPQVKNGDTVKVHYTGKLEDGTVFDTSVEREPMEFVVGNGKLITDFEQAVIGMESGQAKTIQISAENAYGPHVDNLVMVVDRNQFPPELEPRIDQMLQVKHENGNEFTVRVTEVSPDNVTLDANHPLAGENLTFDIELVEIS